MRKRNKMRMIQRTLTLVGLAIVLAVGLFFGAKTLVKYLNRDQNVTQEITKEQDKDTKVYKGVVVLDPGHGGNDPGCSNNGNVEKEITLEYANLIGKILEENEIKVIYTRTTDTNLEEDTYAVDENGTTQTTDLRARAELGEQYGADYFVSIHVDASNDGSGSGNTVHAHSGHTDSIDLATYINKELSKIEGEPNRGIVDGSSKRVLRLNTTIPVLIEIGFINKDAKFITSKEGKEELSNAIATGIINKVKAGKKEPDKILEKQPDIY